MKALSDSGFICKKKDRKSRVTPRDEDLFNPNLKEFVFHVVCKIYDRFAFSKRAQ